MLFNLDKIIDIDSYDICIKEIKSKVRKEKYKNVLEDIEVGEKKFSFNLKRWELIDIKISTLLKCFYKFLYQKDCLLTKECQNEDDFMNRIESYIEKWLDKLFVTDNVFEENEFLFDLENVITAYVSQLYALAVLSLKRKKCADSCAFLAIAEKIIKKFNEKTKNNKFLFVSAQVFLFISSLLISDEDYYTAIVYQNKCMVICFRLISYLNPNNEYLNLSNLKKSNRNYVEKAILCICISFYHRGICEEIKGNIIQSCDSFSQAKWFSERFLIEVYPELIDFFEDTILRLKQEVKKLLNSKKTNSNKKKHNQMNSINIKKVIKKQNELDILKHTYKETIEKIEKLKFPKFDEDDSKSEIVTEILYSLKMTNFLMSEEFKNLVDDLDKLNIHKIDKETKDKINKKIIEIRDKNSYKRLVNSSYKSDKKFNKTKSESNHYT
jgi:hypothetical protein